MSEVLNYELWIEESLRSVIRRALIHTAEHGLPGSHHFYITFHTGSPGTELAPELKARYPDEMTIVLQHQFWDLTVDDDSFSVTLRFHGKPQRLCIPFSAISAFGDPSVNFGLQLKADKRSAENAPRAGATVVLERPSLTRPETASRSQSEKRDGAEVVTLDTFRKK